jgi:S-adenosyl-L-methionine hydrolase (adenosine-forming)
MIIALLTDFGTKDYFVGAMKGVILSINADAKIVDITHDISPQDISSASFTLANCYKNFPENTIFVGVVDPEVGSNRRAILVKTKDYYFVSPDNGLLKFIFAENEHFQVFELTNTKYFADKISQTFHGRDIFAPVAAHLSKGIEAIEFGNQIKDFRQFEITKPKIIASNQIEAEIIYVDRFGNLITNLKREDLLGEFSLEINGKRIEKLQNFYAEATEKEVFMIFGSADYLEIVANKDSASEILQANQGNKLFITCNLPLT